jgi:hypothetical protein
MAQTRQPKAGPCGIARTPLAVRANASKRELWPAGQTVRHATLSFPAPCSAVMA